MQRVQIHLTLRLLQNKLEQLHNRWKKRRCRNINTLTHATFFTPVAIETTGVFGQRTTEFLKELGHRLRQVSGEANSYAYLTQRLSVAVQRGNAASMSGTMMVDSEDKEFFLYKFGCIAYCIEIRKYYDYYWIRAISLLKYYDINA